MSIPTVSQPEFGRRLRRVRRERGLSQRAIAGGQVTSSYVSLLESGGRVPTLDVVFHLAQRLDTTVEALVGESAAGIPSFIPDPPPTGDVPSAEGPASPAAGPDLGFLVAQQAAQESADAGDYASARELLQTAFDTAVSRGDLEAAVQSGLRLQKALTVLGAREERLHLLDRLMQMPALSRATALQLALRTDQASALRDVGRLAEARSAALIALGQAQDPAVTGTPAHVRCLGVLVSTLCELNDLTEVEALVREMIDLAARGDRPGLRGRAHWVAAMAYGQLGQSGRAREQVRAAAEHLVSPELPLTDWVRFCRSVASILLDEPAEVQEARRWLEDAEHTARIIGVPVDIAAVAALQARLELTLGRPAGAVELLERIVGEGSPLSGLDLIRAQLGYADALVELGRSADAVESLRRTAELCEQSGALQIAVQVWRRMDGLRKE